MFAQSVTLFQIPDDAILQGSAPNESHLLQHGTQYTRKSQVWLRDVLLYIMFVSKASLANVDWSTFELSSSESNVASFALDKSCNARFRESCAHTSMDKYWLLAKRSMSNTEFRTAQ
jgi:hypothetical protein